MKLSLPKVGETWKLFNGLGLDVDVYNLNIIKNICDNYITLDLKSYLTNNNLCSSGINFKYSLKEIYYWMTRNKYSKV